MGTSITTESSLRFYMTDNMFMGMYVSHLRAELKSY